MEQLIVFLYLHQFVTNFTSFSVYSHDCCAKIHHGQPCSGCSMLYVFPSIVISADFFLFCFLDRSMSWSQGTQGTEFNNSTILVKLKKRLASSPRVGDMKSVI